MLRINRVYIRKSGMQLFALLMLVTSGAAFAGEPVGDNWHRDWNSAWEESQAEGRPILIFFTMDNCYFCEKMCRETFANKQVLQEIEREFVLAYVHVKSNPSLARKLNVRLFPTTVIIGPDGAVVDSMIGYVGPEQFRPRLQSAEAKFARR